jgi:CheY-like chemotaxis protein
VRRLEPVAPVRIDRGRLGQVLVNLLVNAAQALPRTRDDGRENVVTVSTRSAGDLVEIEVADNGVGIPEEHLPLIWTPFFTTKDADSGTGLGLWITRDIVERAGGEIRVGPGIDAGSKLVGTRFVVTLPVVASPDELSSSAPPPRAAASSGARLSVLVVEDEVTFARRLASELGQIHAVTVVHGGREALRLLTERPYDVVLSDLRMPDVSGEALYAAIRARDEAQARAFVFMTGIGFLPEVQDFLGGTGQPVLHKPFGIDRALEAIATASAARFAVPGASR